MSLTDPRTLGGDIIGDDADPHAENAVDIDITKAVLLGDVHVTIMGNRQTLDPILCMLLSGRVNKSEDRAKVLYLFDTDGAAAIVSELIAMASRMGPSFRDDLMARVEQLIEDGDI
jgi:hypothetical protein